MAVEYRPELERVEPCVHGSIGPRELAALGLESVVDFSASCNPLGASPAVREALRGLDLSRYPDDECGALRRAIGEAVGQAPERIVVGNGSVELIWLLANAYLRPGDTAAVVGPTFGEYARAARIAGAHVAEFRAREEDAFRVRLDDLLAFVRNDAPRVLFLCNPNNPTGAYLRRNAVGRIKETLADGLLVVDEAYLSFVEEPESLLDMVGDDLVLVRSLTKDHGLAGLRLGYCVGGDRVVEALHKVRPPWSVNAAAQAAGLAALADGEHLARAREAVGEAKAYLTRELGALGLTVVPSAANFLLVRVGQAAAFWAALLRRGYCVRDCTSFGLPAYIRIGVRTLPECRGLLAAIREVVDDR